MIVEVSHNFKKINLGVTGVDEIIQNVAFVLRSYKYTFPMDRNFGHGEYLDMPMNLTIAAMNIELIEAIQNYEPRVTVSEITYDSDEIGQLRPKVKVAIDKLEL